MDHETLFEKYNHIVTCEERILGGSFTAPPSAPHVLGIVTQLEYIAKSSMIPRCIGFRYGTLKPGHLLYESVSAHTNLVKAIVDRVLAYQYGVDFDKTDDGFTYREVMAVIERHDLAENIIGDIPDNGKRQDKDLSYIEHSYLRQFASLSPIFEAEFENHVKNLYKQFELKIGLTGQLIYGADKLAAILIALEYDHVNLASRMTSNYENASCREQAAMYHCQYREYHVGGPTGDYYLCRTSEMWTYSGFVFQELYKYDKTGLLMAILIMKTLINNEEWYEWREKEYEKL